MIIDKETNFVYFSSLIKSVEKYTPFWVRLKRILVEKGIHYGFIEHTRDIWCRDYMPIQTGIRQFVQFDYFPDYYLSPKYISQLTIPSEVSLDYTFELSKTDLIIDGGYIVKSDNSAILTDKIWKDNARLKKTTVLSLLKKALGIERIYVIPQLPYDMTGHADGMVRFIDDKNLIVADYSKESKTWRTKMDRALEKTGLNIHLFPSETIIRKNEHGDYTAEGVYINFLRIGEYHPIAAISFRERCGSLQTHPGIIPRLRNYSYSLQRDCDRRRCAQLRNMEYPDGDNEQVSLLPAETAGQGGARSLCIR